MSLAPPPTDRADKPLFTPGPLSTSPTVKRAMLRDLGSRDSEFIELVREIRREILAVGGVSQQAGYECVLMQGSGTFCVEGVITSIMPREGKLLVVSNGAYGERMVAIARRHGIETVVVRASDREPPNAAAVEAALAADRSIRMAAVVHCETTSGIVNPIEEIGAVVRRHGAIYFVDSMSAFGAVPFDFERCGIDFLVSSANKCIQGVPGFGFAICRRDALVESEGRARTLSLDLVAQWQGLERNGQFRFTPPTHVLLAFRQALAELRDEGGVEGRFRRYRENRAVLSAGMGELGFAEYLPEELRGPIITSYHYPRDERFEFEEFYNRLSDKGFVIYPGKVSDADCFRVGTIGHIFPEDVRGLVDAIGQVIAEMGIKLPLEP